MAKGITNFDTENYFKNEQNEDIQKNHMGVYLMDSITKYINFYEIIK